jgi:tetratricopeptide repeat protein
VIELHGAGKYGEAIPLAERYAEAMKTRGPDRPEYATALNNLALLLQATNRLAHAEFARLTATVRAWET